MTDMFGSDLKKGDFIITAASTTGANGQLRVGIIVENEPQWSGVTQKLDAFVTYVRGSDNERVGLTFLVIPHYCMKVDRNQIRGDIAQYLEDMYKKMEVMKSEIRNV